MALRTEPVEVHDLGVEMTLTSGEEIVPVTKLARTKEASVLGETTVPIYEYQRLSVQVLGADAELRFPTVDEEALAFPFSYSAPYQKIYPTDELRAYPWSNGDFIYEVEIGGAVYYGAIRVIPHHLSEAQFSQIADLIEGELPGLTVHHHRQMAQLGGPLSGLNRSQQSLLEWLDASHSELASALDSIERETDASVKRHYRIEQTPKRLDRRSLEWQHSSKGARHAGKFLNRKHHTDVDTPENQYVKYRVKSLLTSLDRLMRDLFQEKDRLDALAGQYAEEIRTIQGERLVPAGVGTARDEELTRHTVIGKKENRKVLLEKRDGLREVLDRVAVYQRMIESKLRRPFWRQVDEVHPRVPAQMSGRGYLSFLKLWKNVGSRVEHGHSRDKVPVLHPTSKLYEYYTLLKMIRSFADRGYAFKQDSLARQLKDGLLFSELHEGTAVVLEKDGAEVHLVYDQEVEYRSKEAIANGSYFFSKFAKRKPDIRIDHYDTTSGEPLYRSSVIIEVKYSPLRNIHSASGSTKAAEQMNEYIGIKYYCPYRNDYFSRIREVICVYPGKANESVVLNTEAGKFVQFYPTGDEVVGQKEIETILDRWLKDPV
ncbi:DUF2357 domain-containing protein [Halobacillus salinus]|uniref:DUF2357 domain-containing protein n=1 Tax=Halobacillus salinus TaxID=192814 RepID=UPI0009A774F0|nr:DUF2357 domain-containing protein [Halobacillus salinus]